MRWRFGQEITAVLLANVEKCTAKRVMQAPTPGLGQRGLTLLKRSDLLRKKGEAA
jgi:hypothetical protein